MKKNLSKKQKIIAKKAIENIIESRESMRELGRFIEEDISDISRWKSGILKIKIHAVVKICQKFNIDQPSIFRPDIFPDNLKFIFE